MLYITICYFDNISNSATGSDIDRIHSVTYNLFRYCYMFIYYLPFNAQVCICMYLYLHKSLCYWLPGLKLNILANKFTTNNKWTYTTRVSLSRFWNSVRTWKLYPIKLNLSRITDNLQIKIYKIEQDSLGESSSI